MFGSYNLAHLFKFTRRFFHIFRILSVFSRFSGFQSGGTCAKLCVVKLSYFNVKDTGMLKTLNFYVAKNFLYTFVMAMGVLTFGMTGARLVKVFEYVSNGVDIGTAMMFMVYVLPIAMAFTIPWAALVSIMLVFGRLSADNEITAMRACGVSILQIVAPIIMLAFMLTCICLYLQLEVGPRYLGKAQTVVKSVAVDHPLALFEPGIPIDFNGFSMFIDQKNAETGEIKGIQVYRLNKNSSRIEQDVTASSGRVVVDKEAQVMNIVLQNATIIAYENDDDPHPRRSFGKEMSFAIEYGKQFNSKRISLRDKHLGYEGLYARSIMMRQRNQPERICEIETELNQRVALALAPMAFLLLGLPMAIRTSRRETSIGLFLSVLLAGLYFGSVLVSDSLKSFTWAFPQYIVWIPPALYQIFGAIYIMKIARS